MALEKTNEGIQYYKADRTLAPKCDDATEQVRLVIPS